MPEIPELEIYARRITERFSGAQVTGFALPSLFLLRSAEIPLERLVGRELSTAERLGKQLAIEFSAEGEQPLWLVIHLMLAGRLDQRAAGKGLPKKSGLFRLDFDDGSALALTENTSRKQASMVLVQRTSEAPRVDRAAIDPLSDAFTIEHLQRVLAGENRQLKNALKDWRAIGLGNAYSDEVLRAAGLSPMALTQRLAAESVAALHGAIRSEMARWIARVDQLSAGRFPTAQKAWRGEMVVHGKHDQPCAVCGDTVRRVSYASRDTGYCPTCQTGGKLLADRRRSRFLK